MKLGVPQEKRKDNRLILLYKGLKGKASIRVLIRILKVGVRESSSVKNRSPRPNLGVPLSKR